GFAVAEPVNSTLTLEEGRKDTPAPVDRGNGSSISGIAQTGGLKGFGSGGGLTSGGARAPSGAKNSSGASSAPPGAPSTGAARAAAAAGGGPAPIVDPRAIAAAQARALELPTS